jgi:putative sterol carrier protein
MERRFPERSWVEGLAEKLNSDAGYARIARNWEGDLLFVIEPDGALKERVVIFLDLWHGKCRGAEFYNEVPDHETAYSFHGSYRNFAKVLIGEWPPMQALLTRKLQVSGSMAYLARNLPTVIEFVRCCQENTTSILGQESDDVEPSASQR